MWKFSVNRHVVDNRILPIDVKPAPGEYWGGLRVGPPACHDSGSANGGCHNLPVLLGFAAFVTSSLSIAIAVIMERIAFDFLG